MHIDTLNRPGWRLLGHIIGTFIKYLDSLWIVLPLEKLWHLGEGIGFLIGGHP